MEKVFITIVCCVSICITQGNPIMGSISNLIHFRRHCLTADVDDDGVVEYGDVRHNILRADINRDGGVSPAEISKDPAMKEITKEDFHVYDLDQDGLLTLYEFNVLFFLKTAEYGDNRDLQECLQFFAIEEKNVVSDEEISVKSFVISEKSFNFMDIDDDGLVSDDEYQSEYRVADFNQDGNLTDLELKGFRPIFLISIDEYCSDISVGCSMDDFMPLFSEADKNGNGFLDLKEYVTRFGK